VANEHPIYSVAIHVDDLESIVTSLEHITCPRHPTEREHRQAAQRVIVLHILITQQRIGLERPRHCLQVQTTVHQPAAIFASHNGRLFAWFRREFANHR